MKATYHQIGCTLSLSVDVAELPRADQIALMRDLMNETGLTEALRSTPEAIKHLDDAWKLMVEQTRIKEQQKQA
jgi:hypothetical protein